MSIIDNAKDIANLIKKYNDQELYEKIVELREEILELREESLKLKEENKRLRDADKFKGKLIRKGNCYYLEDDQEGEHPYCTTCWDYEQRLVGLLKGPHGSVKCNICAARKK